MEDIRLEVLGITIPAIPNVHYHDDGFVDSIDETTSGIYGRYSINKDEEYRLELILDRLSCGKCMQIIKDDTGVMKHTMEYTDRFMEKDVHIVYSKTKLGDPSSIMSMTTRAHEETHALDLIRRIDLLEDRLFEEQRVKIDLNSEHHEIKAIIGMYYALKSRGRGILSSVLASPKLMLSFVAEESYFQAYKIYNRSKISKKEYYSIINPKTTS